MSLVMRNELMVTECPIQRNVDGLFNYEFFHEINQVDNPCDDSYAAERDWIPRIPAHWIGLGNQKPRKQLV